jgi:hypothetical protein
VEGICLGTLGASTHYLEGFRHMFAVDMAGNIAM